MWPTKVLVLDFSRLWVNAKSGYWYRWAIQLPSSQILVLCTCSEPSPTSFQLPIPIATLWTLSPLKTASFLNCKLPYLYFVQSLVHVRYMSVLLIIISQTIIFQSLISWYYSLYLFFIVSHSPYKIHECLNFVLFTAVSSTSRTIPNSYYVNE